MLVQPRNAVEQVLLERHGDQLLHLGRGQAQRLRLDLHRWRHELRVDVDWRGPQLGDADHHQPDGQRDDKTPESQARAKDPAHRRYPLRKRQARSAIATVSRPVGPVAGAGVDAIPGSAQPSGRRDQPAG